MEGKCGQRRLPKNQIKELKKSRVHRVDLYGFDRGNYEVIHHSETLPNGDFKNFKYTVHIEENMMSKCTCLKSNLIGIHALIFW
jgi:hypothetical protein